MFCAKCGAEIKEGSKSCGKCGARVGKIKAVESDGKKLPFMTLSAGAAVLLLAAVIGAGCFFLFRGKDASESVGAESGEDEYPVHTNTDVRTDADDSRVTPDREVDGSPEGESGLTESEKELSLEENQKLQRLLNNMAQTAWWSNGVLWMGDNGTTYSDMANGMQVWADGLYHGNWENLGDLVSAVSFWQDTPYVTEPLDLPEGGKDPMDDSEYGVSLTKEQMEYLAYAAVGTEWKMQSTDEILGSVAAYGSEIKYNDDIIRIIDTSYDSYIWLELENIATGYMGDGNWRITADGIYFCQHTPELSNIKFADITFTVTQNPDSCFDGYSVTGMSVAPTDNSEWARAYYDYLTKGNLESDFYDEAEDYLLCFCYIDEDDIPELYVNAGISAGYALYTYYDGKVVRLFNSAGSNDIEWIEGSGRVLYAQGLSAMYAESVWIYEMANGELQQIAEGTLITQDYADWYEGNLPPSTWNGQDVTEEEYREQLNEVFDTAQVEVSWENNVGLDVMLSALRRIMDETRQEESDKSTTGTKITFDGVVEDEVVRIRDVYSDIVSGISAKKYEESNPAEGITSYYDAGILRAVVVAKGTDGVKYTRWYYYENGKLFFAYYEGADAHRFYFYEEGLIRWRYSADASNAQAAVNHDMEETDEYREWETTVLEEGLSFK